MTNKEYSDGLRAIADFYEANDDMPQCGDLRHYMWNKEDFIAAVKVLARGGMVHKSVDPESASMPCYKAERKFGEITVHLLIDRKSVCRLVTPAVYDCPDSLLEEAAEYTEAR